MKFNDFQNLLLAELTASAANKFSNFLISGKL